MMNSSFHYRCTDCGREYPSEGVIYLCPACASGNSPDQPPAGVLTVVYCYDSIRSGTSDRDLLSRLEQTNYFPLLPIETPESLPPLRIGNTPMVRYGGKLPVGIGSDRVPAKGHPVPPFSVYLKDDSQNPTFSFKDRASALVSAWAKEHGIRHLVTASTGNAGSSLAGICASQGQEAIILVPAAAPVAKLTQVLMYGATLVPVAGNYDDAFDISVKLSERHGWYNRNTAFNPLTIEGKKTVSYEIYRDLGHRLPDRVFVPAGDGVILAGVYRGFEDLMMLGVTDRVPVVIAVQAEGSAAIAKNLHHEVFIAEPSCTVADSISVDIPRNFRMARRYLRQYNGETVLVGDDEILGASRKLAASSGIFAEPAAAAAFAGMLKMAEQERLETGSVSVVLLTGSGLKDTGAVMNLFSMPAAIEPDVEAVERRITGSLHYRENL